MSCKKKSTKKYTSRPSPPIPAKTCTAKKQKGNDGNWWIAVTDSRGFYRWQRVPEAKKSVKKQSVKKSIKKQSIKKQSIKKKQSAKKSKTKNKDDELSEKQVWRLIQNLDWSKDHDLERCQKRVHSWPLRVRDQVAQFVFEKTEELLRKFKSKDIGLGDSRFSDLMAEVVSHGETFYNDISVAKLKKMEKEVEENFEYVFQEDV